MKERKNIFWRVLRWLDVYIFTVLAGTFAVTFVSAIVLGVVAPDLFLSVVTPIVAIVGGFCALFILVRWIRLLITKQEFFTKDYKHLD